MCTYLVELTQVLSELVQTRKPFDMLDLRDKIRERVGRDVDVRFRDVKFEALAAFERGACPDYVLTIKPIVDQEGAPRTVFVFGPLPTDEELAKVLDEGERRVAVMLLETAPRSTFWSFLRRLWPW